MADHEMQYRVGVLSGPYWRCTCERWRFAARPMLTRKAGNNKIEAEKSFRRHAEVQP